MGPWEALHCHLFDDSQGSRGLKLKARERSLWQSPPFFSFVKLPKPSVKTPLVAHNGFFYPSLPNLLHKLIRMASAFRPLSSFTFFDLKG